jgi:hypothetical protein
MLLAQRPGVAIARAVVRELSEALSLPEIDTARPGAAGLMAPGVLLRAADGWVHPGPPTVWPDVAAMVAAMGGGSPGPNGFPDMTRLAAEAVDAEAGEWSLPAVAVRAGPARAPRVPRPRTARVGHARVVVLGATWAAPLTGRVLGELGASVTRVVDPRRVDPFPLRDRLRHGQAVRGIDLGTPAGRDELAALLEHADLLVDGTTPRVLRNLELDDTATPVVRIAAFADGDRPGYGLAAEARGGWATRHDPPRLGRSSVADPVAGLLAALAAAELLDGGDAGTRTRVSLEDAVGLLLARERGHG